MTTRHAILVLADASLSKNRILQVRALAQVSRPKNPNQDVAHKVLLDVFCAVKDVIIDLADFWLQEEGDGKTRHILDLLLPSIGNGTRLATSMYWLLVRLSMIAPRVYQPPLISD